MQSNTRFSPIIGFVTAESLSLLGNQMAAVAIPLLVLHYTQSPIATGIASAGNIIPIIIAAIFGGRAINKFGAWNVSVIADVLSCASVVALPLAFVTFHDVSPFLIFVLVFMGALFDPTGIAARQTLVPRLAILSGRSLENINSWRGALENGADFLGPVVGVVFIGLIGIVNTFYLNAVTFLLCAGIFSLAVPKTRDTMLEGSTDAVFSMFSVWRSITFIFTHPQLKALAMVGMVANFAILPFLGLLLPVLATQKFGSTATLGICLSVFGLAATVGAASFSWLSRWCSRSVIYYGGLCITGSALILCALSTNMYSVVASAGLAGLLLGAGNPLMQTILQEETPAAIAGEVFTSFTAIHFVMGPFGLLLAGIMTEFSSVEQVLWVAGGLLLVTAIIGWSWLPLQPLRAGKSTLYP